MSIDSEPPTLAITVSYLALLGELLERRGISISEWLKDSPLDQSELYQPDKYVDLQSTACLVARAIELSNDPALGVYFGQLLNLNAHGILGFAGLVSPNVEASLRVGFHFAETRSPLLSLKLIKNDTDAIIQIGLKTELSLRLEQFCLEAIFNSFSAMCNYLFGDESPDVTVLSTMERPGHAEIYPAFYKGNVTFLFNQNHNQIVIPIDFLKRPLISSDESSLKFAKQRMDIQLENIRSTVSKGRYLLEFIEEWIETSPAHIPSIEDVAKRLNTTSRTLHRKLKKEGMSYRGIVDKVRTNKAQAYLKNTELSILEISSLLSYNDSSNFSRAFSKWTGMSPKNYRKSKRTT